MIVVEQLIKEYQYINIVTTYPNWTTGETVNFGDIRFYGHYYYRSVIDSNTGLIPSDNPDEWLRWSVSNRYAQIDLRATTTTEWNATTATVPADDALITTFANGGYDVLAFGKVDGGNITVEVFDGGDALLYTFTETIYNRPNSNNWYGYYFDEFLGGVEADFLFRIPPVTGGKITVAVSANDEGYAKVGYMVGGNGVDVGCSLYGASLGLEDNSLVEIDDFGVTSLTKRVANSFMDIDVIFPASQVKQMERKASAFFGKIVLFIGDDTTTGNYEHLSTLGYVESYTTVLNDTENISASYSIKEII